jgi:HTH-type transcriptional regulator, transcriptional repressor of NAD biosynthesis genes
MKRGLVIGKFMPLHEGHITLIRFAINHCDELIVSMSYKEDDPIPGAKRFSWLKEIFQHDQRIHPQLVVDDFDDDSLPWIERTKVWADFLLGRYGKIDVIFSSEEYGSLLADHLKATHISFDNSRKKVPVSGTAIRLKPLSNWNFIPKEVRPFFVKKVCFYGPESTGKSIMSSYLAEVYQTEFVPEVAREIVTSNEFTVDDIIKIGYAQTERVIEKTKKANRVLFCDTDLITTQIYCRHYLGIVPEVLYELEKRIQYDQYFLFDVDVPWVSDGLRDLGNRRVEMFNVFKTELDNRSIPYKLVMGTYQQREEFIRAEIDKLLLV